MGITKYGVCLDTMRLWRKELSRGTNKYYGLGEIYGKYDIEVVERMADTPEEARAMAKEQLRAQEKNLLSKLHEVRRKIRQVDRLTVEPNCVCITNPNGGRPLTVELPPGWYGKWNDVGFVGRDNLIYDHKLKAFRAVASEEVGTLRSKYPLVIEENK